MFDFLYYYSAFEVFRNGLNPYDPVLQNAALTALQRPEGSGFATFPYPPWLLIFLFPVLVLPLNSAAVLWFLLNMIFIFFCGVFAWKAFRPETFRLIPAVCAGLFFVPIFHVLQWGQISLFITTALCFFLYLVKTRRDILAGLSLLVVIIKPQQSFLLLLLIPCWIVRYRRWKIAISISLGDLFFSFFL